MLSVHKFGFLGGILLLTTLLALCAACGSSSSHELSQAQAQAISHEVVTAAEAALSSAVPAAPAEERVAHPSLAKAVSGLQPDQLPGCTTSEGTTTCNWPVNYSGSCPDGGTISASGDFDFTLNSSGSGSDTSTFTITPTNCGVEPNLTINGNPNIQLSTTVNFANDQIVYPVTFAETGGISYGPNPSGSCSLNVTYTVSSSTSCTVSGTLCGQSLSGSC
jgi:hypothetical protein